MHPFAYAVAPSAGEAVEHVARQPAAEFIAGGTDVLQLLQEGVKTPAELIDINRLPLAGVALEADRLRIGALCRMADVAADSRVRAHGPVVVEALLASASAQVRNAATIGGNLLQRTRCLYFRDVASPCNKRVPGSGCPARDGENRMNAILGGSAHCIATYPGDLAVALAAVDAEVHVTGVGGDRVVPLAGLHRPPGDTPDVETVLEPGDLITAVTIPRSALARRSRYLKVRDRASFEWAVASAAVALDVADGAIRDARVAVGGVATTPWRARSVEAALVGHAPTTDRFREAAARAADGAEPRGKNAFKVELIARVVERALTMVQ